MRILNHLFENNKRWAGKKSGTDPEFFGRLLDQQNPEYLWIGCSDSRVPANDIVGLQPGELFVHRNVANLVIQTDLNCLSVIQYAVEVLQVKHIIVCGHYGCGGIKAVLQGKRYGLIDNWLRNVRDIYERNRGLIDVLPTLREQCARLCELNVIEQVGHVCQTTVLIDAWSRKQAIAVHGWIYALEDGLLRDLGMCVTSGEELQEAKSAALGQLGL